MPCRNHKQVLPRYCWWSIKLCFPPRHSCSQRDIASENHSSGCADEIANWLTTTMSAAPKDGPTGLPFTFDMSETRVKSELPCDGTSGSFTGGPFSGFPTFGLFTANRNIPGSHFEHLDVSASGWPSVQPGHARQYCASWIPDGKPGLVFIAAPNRSTDLERYPNAL